MNRQLTPDGTKSTMRSTMLPKIVNKQQKLEQQQSIYQSVDAEKFQKRTRNFDFSNLQRTIQTSYSKSRQKQRTILQPLSNTINNRIQTKQQLNRIINSLIRIMQNDAEFMNSCKHLHVNSQKLSQLLLMLTPLNFETEGFFTIHRKLKQQQQLNEQPYFIEIDRMFFAVSKLNIPVPLQHLMQLSQYSDCLYQDNSFGMVVNYQQMLSILKQAYQVHKNMQSQQELSTTTASDDEERLSPSARIVQRLLSRNTARKVQFKQKRLGYINDQNMVAYYDSFTDLKKKLERDWNAKNYIFGCIRFGYIDLIKYPQYVDHQTKKELKIFGLERSKLPISMQVVYKHKSQVMNQEKALNKLNLYQPKNIYYESYTKDPDFISKVYYLNVYSLSNKFNSIYTYKNDQITDYNIMNLDNICIKSLFTEQTEYITKDCAFDDQQGCFRVKKREYRPLDLEQADSSGSEPDLDVYDPLYVKSIQSYPQYLIETQIQFTFPLLYRFYYNKMFTNAKIIRDNYTELVDQCKIKPEQQFKEKFVNVPSPDNCNYQRHKYKQPETVDLTDESDNEIYEQPLEALDKQDLSLSFKVQPLIKEEDFREHTQYLKSQSSIIIQDEQKVNDKIQFAHNIARPFICLQYSYALLLQLRFPLQIHMQIIPSIVERELPLKEVNFEASTIIIDNTLTIDQGIKDLESYPIIDIDSEEDPSFDEMPLEIDLPEQVEQQTIEQKNEDDEEITIDKVTEYVDLEIKDSLTIEVKNDYVSKLEIDGYPIYFYLDEHLRKTEPTIHRVTMEGKEIQSVQISCEQKGSKIYMKLFAIKALCDQRLESNIEKKQNYEEEDKQVNIYEPITLPEQWNQGQFVINLYYLQREDVNQNVEWLKTVLITYFPQIIIVEEYSESFEAYIYGVGPKDFRDANGRTLLFRKDIEDWTQFNQEFQFKTLLIYDTICYLISLYGSIDQLSFVQNKYISENHSKHTKSKFEKLHLHPYKYVENVERERIRPTTGYSKVGIRRQNY
ncbi:unnamed protein product [Paramecium octaurelia]|uniref:Uncharacterized protein n=1 Tax=Paramecium octaurelia TaxID=43137 RepID=A0A8S1V7G8_PAROT|nr:unnamed protein product [Paramecium octaurelia]